MAIATSTFSGFRPEAIDFLADLAANNDREWFDAAQGRLRAAAQGAARGAGRRPRGATRGPRHPAARRSEALDLPDLPRHPLLEGQVAVQDAPRGELPVAGALGRTAAWSRPTAQPTGTAATSTSSRARCTSAAACGWPEKPRLDAFRRAIVEDPDRVRAALEEPGFLAAFGPVTAHEHLKRVPPGLPADHPMADLFRYKDVVFGRRPVRRRGAVAVAAGHHRGRVRRRACRSSASSRPSARSVAMRFGAAFWINRTDWPALRDACLAVERGRLGQPLDRRPPARRRGRPDRRQVRGLDDPRRAGGPDPARPARPARGGQHVPEPGPDRQARDDARSPLGRPGRARPRAAAGSSSSTTPSGSTSARASATASTGSTSPPD